MCCCSCFFVGAFGTCIRHDALPLPLLTCRCCLWCFFLLLMIWSCWCCCCRLPGFLLLVVVVRVCAEQQRAWPLCCCSRRRLLLLLMVRIIIWLRLREINDLLHAGTAPSTHTSDRTAAAFAPQRVLLRRQGCAARAADAEAAGLGWEY